MKKLALLAVSILSLGYGQSYAKKSDYTPKHSKNEFNNGEEEYVRRGSNRFLITHSFSMIGSKIYPVVDWSMNGLQIVVNGCMLPQNQKLKMILKFKLEGMILKIPCKGKVVRQVNDRVGIELDQLSRENRLQFMKVLDNCVASEFFDSQTYSNSNY